MMSRHDDLKDEIFTPVLAIIHADKLTDARLYGR